MAKSNRVTEGMKKAKSRNIQVIYSEPRRIFKEKYLTKKGKRLFASAKTQSERDAIWKTYGKNRYVSNPNAKIVKVITRNY